MRSVCPEKAAPVILRRSGELELERALAGMTDTGPAEVVARRRGGVLGDERGVDSGVEDFRELRFVIEVEHQNGTSGSVFGAAAMMSRRASWKPPTETSMRVMT